MENVSKIILAKQVCIIVHQINQKTLIGLLIKGQRFQQFETKPFFVQSNDAALLLIHTLKLLK